MEYFLIKSSVKVPLQPIHMDTNLYRYRLTEENYERLPKSEIYYYHYTEDIEIPELMLQPTFMAGDVLQQIISLYDETVSWKSLYMLPDEEDKIMELSKHYWIPGLTRIKCLHPQAELQPNGAVTKLVLDKKRLRNLNIFQVEETQENFVLVSLALAESISRRQPYGVRLKRVEVR